MDLDEDNPGFNLMQLLQGYSIYSSNTPTLRAVVSDPQSRSPVGLSGGRFAKAFSELRRTLLDQDESLLDSVFELVDWVADIETTNIAGTLLSPSITRTKHVLKFTDRFMKKSRNTLTAYDASEGALYVLFTAVLCLSANAPKLFAIDNLDQALNPRLASRLAGKLGKWLADTDKDRQLLFTAHNSAVLDGLLQDNEIRLFAVDRNSNGHTQATRITLSDGQPLADRTKRQRGGSIG